MKIHALATAVVSLLSLIGALIAKLAAHDSLLLLALGALFVQWHAQRRRQMRRQERDATLTTMRKLSEDAVLLSCSQLATRHPELRCELHIFERAVVRSLADIHHGRPGAPPLALIHRYVTEMAPSLLRAVQEYDDKLTLQGVCRQFRRMSQRLLPRTAEADSAPDTQFAFSSGPSGRPQAALAPR
jgi:hypothetical protein